MTFPRWHQPVPYIGAILVNSQEELDALGDWPNGPADAAADEDTRTKADLAAELEAKGVTVDKRWSKARLLEELAK